MARDYYSEEIMNLREFLGNNHACKNIENALPYINELLRLLYSYINNKPLSPVFSFIAALYDGLVFNDKWTTVTSAEYENIRKILSVVINDKNLDFSKVDKAINNLDKMGIDTTPF